MPCSPTCARARAVRGAAARLRRCATPASRRTSRRRWVPGHGAFLIALLLIAFILMSQFNSVLKPVIIMTSVIMSTVGVLLGLIVFRMPFGIIMTGVGVISLAGVVVNNAIVLIDYIDLLRDARWPVTARGAGAGGRTRFRPVLLTAVTTVLGLVPLADRLQHRLHRAVHDDLDPNIYWGGEQAAWWGPMAIAVIAGPHVRHRADARHGARAVVRRRRPSLRCRAARSHPDRAEWIPRSHAVP
jgi:hypothetical protein